VQCLDYPICKTRHWLHSIDADFQDGLIYISGTVSIEKAASTSDMTYCHKARLKVAKMQDQNSFTLD